MNAGDIYTVAGDGVTGFSGDGDPATGAALYYPGAVTVDRAGNLLIADTFNSRVRLLAFGSCSSDCPYGLAAMKAADIYTIAGNGTHGFTRDGDPATSSELYYPVGIAVDGAGNLLIADTGNDRVRLVAAAACAGDCPYGLRSMARGDIYTIAGGGNAGFSGDGGPAAGAALRNLGRSCSTAPATC